MAVRRAALEAWVGPLGDSDRRLRSADIAQPPFEESGNPWRQPPSTVGVRQPAQIFRSSRIRQHQRADAAEPHVPADQHQDRGELLARIPADESDAEYASRPTSRQHLGITLLRIIGHRTVELTEPIRYRSKGRPACKSSREVAPACATSGFAATDNGLLM